MIVLMIVAGLLVGGAVGGLLRRRSERSARGTVARRTEDSPSFGAQAGFTNQGPQL